MRKFICFPSLKPLSTLTCAFTFALFFGYASRVSASTKIILPESANDRKAATLYLPREVSPPMEVASDRNARKSAVDNHRSLEKTPLVVLLHAYPSTGRLENWYMGLSEWVDRKQFALLLAEGTENKWGAQFWNATDSCCDSYRSGVDDVGYLTKLIESVVDNHNIDRRRIYLIGHSAGGFMVNRMACEQNDLFAGYVSFAGGGYLHEAQCLHPNPNAYLQIHAINDSNVAIDNESANKIHSKIPREINSDGALGNLDYAGGDQMVANWQKRNHCDRDLVATQRLDLIKAVKGSDTQEWRATGCSAGSDVYYWKIDAHSEPFYIPHVPALNPATSGLILDFLLQHSRTH